LYNKIFVETDEVSETVKWKIIRLDSEIREYHTQLLKWENSIKSDIKEEKEKITEFYMYLFWTLTEENIQNWEVVDWDLAVWDVREKKIKTMITQITDFSNKLEWKEDSQWYRQKIEDLYTFLFEKSEWEEQNKIDQVKGAIHIIDDFSEKMPWIKKEIDWISSDIRTKQNEVNNLLNKATGSSLVEWYIQSKNYYNHKVVYRKYGKKKSINLSSFLQNSYLRISSLFTYLLDYFLFVVPLFAIVVIFVWPEKIELLTGIVGIKDGIKTYSIRNRIILSFPLWWISWFWQRNISHKRRLVEEYNHKEQVARMYLNFSTNKDNEWNNTYRIDPEERKLLNKKLIEVIGRNPSQIYWKDQTIVDKIIEMLLAFKGKSWDDEEKSNNDSEITKKE
jgi:hypothetical protein